MLYVYFTGTCDTVSHIQYKNIYRELYQQLAYTFMWLQIKNSFVWELEGEGLVEWAGGYWVADWRRKRVFSTIWWFACITSFLDSQSYDMFGFMRRNLNIEEMVCWKFSTVMYGPILNLGLVIPNPIDQLPLLNFLHIVI